MEKVKLKKMIVLGIIVILIIMVILIINIIIKKSNYINPSLENYDIGNLVNGKKPEKLYSDTIYFSIDASIKKTIAYAENSNSKAVYDLLNNQYVQNNNINEINVLEKTGLANIKTYRTEEIYELVGIECSSYYIKSSVNGNYKYFNMNWDIQSDSYDFAILTKTEFENKINTEIVDVEEESKIERNDYNSIAYKYFGEQEVVEQYFLDYIENAIKNPNQAYNLLDEEYKNVKFENIENFNKYISNNNDIRDIYNAKLTDMSDFSSYQEYMASRKNVGINKYSKTSFENYDQYTIIDSFGNYYIFKVTAPMQYTLILDTYTIDLPEFIEKYNNSTEQQKVALNVDRFMQAINDKDYKYAYGCLADSYKNNYFKTLEEFENYAKEKFYDSNIVAYKQFNVQQDLYTYSVIITNEETGDQVNKTFIMKLDEGTGFEMSFDR